MALFFLFLIVGLINKLTIEVFSEDAAGRVKALGETLFGAMAREVFAKTFATRIYFMPPYRLEDRVIVPMVTDNGIVQAFGIDEYSDITSGMDYMLEEAKELQPVIQKALGRKKIQAVTSFFDNNKQVILIHTSKDRIFIQRPVGKYKKPVLEKVEPAKVEVTQVSVADLKLDEKLN